jgi:PAS domain S-box-containing protein
MRLSYRIAAVSVSLLLLLVVGYAGYTSIRRLAADSRTVESTDEINTRLEHLLSRVKDGETGSRGYVITGDPRYLQPYDTAVMSIPPDVVELQRLVVDSILKRRIDSVAVLINRDLALMNEPIQARRASGFSAAQALTMTGRVKAATDSIRRRIGEVQLRLDSLLAARRAQTDRSTHTALAVILLTVVVATILTIAGSAVAQHALRQRDRVLYTHERFFTIAPDMLCVVGRDGGLRELNGAWEAALGYRQAEMKDRPFLDFVHPEDLSKTELQFERLLLGHATVLFENRYRHKNGAYRTFLWSAALDRHSDVVYGAARDITELKKAQTELHQLSGLLPICAHCKKIRDDQGYWNQIESYITNHSEAQFSHGMCPECGERLYGSLYS